MPIGLTKNQVPRRRRYQGVFQPGWVTFPATKHHSRLLFSDRDSCVCLCVWTPCSVAYYVTANGQKLNLQWPPLPHSSILLPFTTVGLCLPVSGLFSGDNFKLASKRETLDTAEAGSLQARCPSCHPTKHTERKMDPYWNITLKLAGETHLQWKTALITTGRVTILQTATELCTSMRIMSA